MASGPEPTIGAPQCGVRRRWAGELALVGVALVLSSALTLGGVLASPALAVEGPADPYFSRQWSLVQINAPSAWPTTTGVGIRIGVVDTGVDATHEDLAGKVVAETSCVDSGGDSSRCSGNARDDHGHGTHVSAIAAATTRNGLGIAGVAPGANLVVARALVSDEQGGASGLVPDVVAAIRWVVDNGARVVNLSLGSELVDNQSGIADLAPGIRYAWERGAIPVLAVGNGTSTAEPVDYGALEAVVVGATENGGQVAPYSRSLALTRWGIVAPGGSVAEVDDKRASEVGQSTIVSAWAKPDRSDGYAGAAGTSMAAPHVAGGLALLLAQGLSPIEAVERLLDRADRSRPCGAGCSGRLDMARAVGPRVEASDGTMASPDPAPATSPASATEPVTTPPASGTQALAPPTDPPTASTTLPVSPSPSAPDRGAPAPASALVGGRPRATPVPPPPAPQTDLSNIPGPSSTQVAEQAAVPEVSLGGLVGVNSDAISGEAAAADDGAGRPAVLPAGGDEGEVEAGALALATVPRPEGSAAASAGILLLGLAGLAATAGGSYLRRRVRATEAAE